MNDEQIRQTLSGLSEEEKSAWMFQFLQQHLNQFANLGMPVNAIDQGVQHLLKARAASAQPQERLALGKAFLLLAANIYAYPAEQPKTHDAVNPHTFLKVLEFICNEWMTQAFDRAALQEILEGFLDELKKPWSKPELN